MPSASQRQRIAVIPEHPFAALLSAFSTVATPATLSLHDYDGSLLETLRTWAIANNVEIIERGGDHLVHLDAAHRTVICLHDMRVTKAGVTKALSEWRPSDEKEVANG